MWLTLKTSMNKKKIGIRALARALEKEPTAVSRYFQKGYDPKLSQINEWAKALGVSPLELLDMEIEYKGVDKMIIERPDSAIISIKNSGATISKDGKYINPKDTRKKKR